MLTPNQSDRTRTLVPAPVKLFGAACVAAIALAACGSDAAPISAPVVDGSGQAESAAAAPAADANAGGPAAVTSAASSLGEILVGDDGLTVYGFTNDVDAVSACYGTCAEAWPPVIVGPDWTVAPGLDSGIFNAFTRDDGQLQLVAGKWPLYYFAGDAIPGDLNGQGSGDVWFVVGTDGKLIKDSAANAETDDSGSDSGDAAAAPAPASPPVAVGATDAGDVLVDEAGLSLYGFLQDADGIPTCEGACADAWPPVLVDSTDVPAGLDPEVFSVVEGPGGTLQLKAGKWPLYRFAGDGQPGDINGQGSGDVWFLARPDGGLIKDAPAESAPATTTDY
jgi:predicted lipoprotein with Yx(FWY)xxD motif